MFKINNGELDYFRNDEGISEVTIPEEVTSIGDEAFHHVDKVTSVAFHSGVTRIGKDAFCDTKIKTIDIPESITHIGDMAFCNCRELTEVVIHGTAVEIGYGAFNNCVALECITMDSGLLNGDLFKPDLAKMLTVKLTDKGIEAVVAFRKGYFGNKKYEFQEDYIYPIGGQATKVYDQLLAEGKYDGFVAAENPRIKAMLLRITDKNDPISDDVKPQFQNFLLSKLQKTIKTALEGNIEVVIPALVDLGVIYDETESKVIKALKKLGSEDANRLADELHERISRG